MKTLYESLLESLRESLFDNIGSPFKLIDSQCKNNINGKYVIDEKTLTINSPDGISIINKNLVEFPSYIRFGTVKKGFYCANCTSLKSLVGAPEEVGGDFYCNDCSSLKSIKGISPNIKGKIHSDTKRKY